MQQEQLLKRKSVLLPGDKKSLACKMHSCTDAREPRMLRKLFSKEIETNGQNRLLNLTFSMLLVTLDLQTGIQYEYSAS